MKPNFALSLSFDGIKLLHRAAGGWREVGEVELTSSDLAGELAVLRKTAASLEPAGVRTKLLIPASQIKYLTIETLGLSEAACRKAAEAALQDATPYEIADLAYDISLDGAQTHIAAVARETLAEAEAFATEHRFHPVSFVAVPADAPYLGEPYFGETEGAVELLGEDETVDPDGIAVVIVGAIPPQQPLVQEVEPVEDGHDKDVAPLPEAAEDSAAEPATNETVADKATSPIEAPQDPAPEVNEPQKPKEAPPQETSAASSTVDIPPAKSKKSGLSFDAPAQVVAPKPAPASKAEDVTPSVATDVPNVAPKPAPKVETVPEPKPLAAEVKQTPPETPNKIETDQPAQPAAVPDTQTMASDQTQMPAQHEPISPARLRALAAAAITVEQPAPAPVSAAKVTAPSVAVPSSTPIPKPTPVVTAPSPAQSVAAPATGFASRRNSETTSSAKPLGGAERTLAVTPTPDSSSLNQPAPVALREADAVIDAPAPRKAGFLSRRKPRTNTAVPVPAPTAQVAAAGSEAERMTVFGARADQVGGKPRFLGLIMTVILLVFLAGVAAWAAVFLDEGLSGLIKKDGGRAIASAPENQIDPEVIRTADSSQEADTATEENVQIAALDPVLSAEDTAVLDALQDPLPQPQRPVITEQEAAARYAVTGIWPLAPSTPLGQADTPADPVYRSGIDGVSTSNDAIALPAPRGFETDAQLASVASPPPFGQTTILDASGLVVPTQSGVVTPGGFTLFAASPPLKPPATMARFAVPPTVTAPVEASPLQGFRPQNRPLGLAERSERAQLGGVTRVELAAFRPSLRPRSIQDRAKQAEEAAQKEREAEKEAAATAATEAATAAAAAALAIPQPTVAAIAPAIQNASRYATAKSIRPDTRPRNFSRIVKRAEREAPKETRVAAAASVAPRTVAPKLPSKASVARSATVKNVINLRKVNLIGVYGKPSSRRALIRLSNGRYQKVRVGDRIDGGRVSAISNSELRYSKGGRNVVLKMP